MAEEVHDLTELSEWEVIGNLYINKSRITTNSDSNLMIF